MHRLLMVFRSTVGKKYIMAITGIVLFLYVLLHMLGNLKVFQGPIQFDHYAEGLREFGDPFLGYGQLLWVVRGVLLVAVLLHIVMVVQLTSRARRARRSRYQREQQLSFSLASHTMLWGGILLTVFVVYHILHLTTGTVHGGFVPGGTYQNLVTGFGAWPVTLLYLLALTALGFHIYHGVWSAFQTLGANNERYNAVRRPLAGFLALLVALGFAIVPIAIVLGLVP